MNVSPVPGPRSLIPHCSLLFVICYLVFGIPGCTSKPAATTTAAPRVREMKTFVYPGSDTDLYIFSLPNRYDETLFATCLQGIYNRENGPSLYMVSRSFHTPDYWLEIFTTDPSVGWLRGRRQVRLESIEELYALVKPFVKKAVIWDPDVDASVNVATTIAGVEDGVVLSPELAERMLPIMGMNSADIIDLRGRFTGTGTLWGSTTPSTGSKKNDAYRWAIENYLAKGLNSKNLLCLYRDSFLDRDTDNTEYVQQRDWPVYRRAFVFDLSPWGDEAPLDDPNQRIGLDLETYKMILAEQLRQNEGKNMTEVAGFFNLVKYTYVEGVNDHSRHRDDVAAEWESVFVMSEYNCYQNTAAERTFNQSLHSQFPFTPLKQSRPATQERLRNAVYLSVYWGDYDSAWPLYQFMPNYWEDEERGTLPLGWGINPNLIESYPDIITYFYETAVKDKDIFYASASGAGYFNPSRIQEQYWDMVVEHNRKFFELTDMTINPFILDWENFTDATLDRLTSFSPDGISSIIGNYHRLVIQSRPKVHNGIIIDTMINAIDGQPEHVARHIAATYLQNVSPGRPAFFNFRIVWKSPYYMNDLLDTLKQVRPDLDIRLVNPYEYYRLHTQYMESQ